MKKVLFVCSQNKLRSATAERIFSEEPTIDVASAGLDHDAAVVLSPELVEWADVIFVMTRTHLNKLRKKFRKQIKNQRIYCLDIPDEYDFMDPDLIALLNAHVPRLLRLGR